MFVLLIVQMECLTLEFHAKRSLMEEQLELQCNAHLISILMLGSVIPHARVVIQEMDQYVGEIAKAAFMIVELYVPHQKKNVPQMSSQ